MRFILVLTLVLASGCAAMEHNALISPSEALYHKANISYESGEFFDAIQTYERFLEMAPRSRFAVPAQLNLGMSYYYLSSYEDAYKILKDVQVTDENIKSYIDGILKICKEKAGAAIEADEALLASKSKEVGANEIQITISKAYLDDFDQVNLEGTTSEAADLFVNGKKIALTENNSFKTAVSWRRGRPITIEAENSLGNSGVLDYFPDTEQPDAPLGLRVMSRSSNSIEIEWEENRENDIKGYRVFYRLKGGPSKEVRDIIERGTRYEVVGLQSLVSGANRTFQFQVRAVDLMNNESTDSETLEADLPL